MRTSSSTAVWRGTLPEGEGEFRAHSGAFEGDYSFGTRFGDDPGTNPEELLAAAHAACYSMALANILAEGGHPADQIRTRASCTIDKTEGGPAVTRMHLEVRGRVPGADADAFSGAAAAAKDGCPISKAITGNVEIELDARLESREAR